MNLFYHDGLVDSHSYTFKIYTHIFTYIYTQIYMYNLDILILTL